MRRLWMGIGITFLVGTLLLGCAASRNRDASRPEAGPGAGAGQNGTTDSAETAEAGAGGGVSPGGADVDQTAGEDVKGAGSAGADRKAFVYATEEQFRPMSESVTEEGITYQVLACEVTREFGGRKRENLEDLVADHIDAAGNLTDNSYYVFLKVQFTNATDSEAEILRNHGGIAMFDENKILCDHTIDAVYIDEKWSGGTPGEAYHYKLKAGESVTSEIGWRVDAASLEAGGGKMYYAARFADCLSDQGAGFDEDAVFLQLE